MKKLLTIAAAVFISVFLVAAVNAAPNDSAASPQKSSQSIPKKKSRLSKRNRAKIEVQQMKEKLNAKAASSNQK